MRDFKARNVTERIVQNLADVDFYKLTMLQFIWAHFGETVVTFRFHNRTQVDLLEYIDPGELEHQLARVTRYRFPKWAARELRRSYGHLFRQEFVDWLVELRLPMPTVRIDPEEGLVVEATGRWVEVMLWETITMCIVNRLYFLAKMRELGLKESDVLEEGRARASIKFNRLGMLYPGLRFVDFGTRRRWSFRHHRALLLQAAHEACGALACTSNVYLGLKFGLPLVGTMAHELPMAFQGIFWKLDEGSDRLLSQKKFWQMWEKFYGGHLTVALPDTYGNDFGLSDFEEFAARWAGVRHDSGDPFEFGEKVIAFYERLKIDPKQKLIVFSDGLTESLMEELWDRFHERIQVSFGWGTHLTNDMGCGLLPLSIVMKLVAVHLPDGTTVETVKLSDNPGKATGPTDKVERIMRKTLYDPAAYLAVECVV